MPNLTAIIPAAGTSARMGETNKLLLPLYGKCILAHVVEAVVEAGAAETLVVTGRDDRFVREALAGYPVQVVYNPAYGQGMAASIRRGVLSAPADTDGYLFIPGDLPFIRPQSIRSVIAAFETAEAPIVVATYGGADGHPVLFHRRFRDALLALEGDVGGRRILAAHPDRTIRVDTSDSGVVTDIDTMDAYRRYAP